MFRGVSGNVSHFFLLLLFFSLLCFCTEVSTILFQVIYQFFFLSCLLLISWFVFFLSVLSCLPLCVHSLVLVFLIFLISSQSVPLFCFWDLESPLLLLLWIIFPGGLLSSSSFSCYCKFVSCSFTCNVFRCYLILSDLCVCGLLTTGCWIIVCLASGVWPLMSEFGLEACAIITC